MISDGESCISAKPNLKLQATPLLYWLDLPWFVQTFILIFLLV